MLAASRCLLASQIASRGEFAAAREHGLAAREGLKDLVGLFPQTLDYQGKLARAEQLLGEVAASSGEPALAREHFQAADHTWRPLTAGPEPRPEYCARHASVLESLAEVVAELHGSESQAELLGRAADLRREALQPFPEHTDFRAALAGTLRRLLALEPSSSQGAEELRSELAELEGSGRSGV